MNDRILSNRPAAGLVAAILAVGLFWAGSAAWGGHFLADYTRMMDTYHLSLICDRFGQSLAEGAPKFWFPEFGGGHPTHALWLYGFTGPVAFIWALLPAEPAYLWSCLLSIAFGGLGMFAFLRERDHVPAAAMTGALLFALSEFLFVRTATGGANQVWSLVWAPWVLRAVERAVAGKPRSVPALGLWAGVALLAGHVQVWLFVGPMIAAYALVLVTQVESKARALGRVALGAGIALLAAAVQILPTAELMSVAERPAPADDLFTQWSAPFHVLASKVAPGMFGVRPESYWGGQEFDHELCGYGGAAALLLGLLGLRRGRVRVFWAAVAVFGLLVALGAHTGFTTLLNRLPLIGWARVPGRAQMLTLLGGSVLAAGGVDDWLRGRIDTARLSRVAAAAGIVVAASIVLVVSTAGWPDADAAGNAAIWAIALSVVGGAGVFAALLVAKRRSSAAVLVPVVVGLAAAFSSLPTVSSVASDFFRIDWSARIPAELREHRIHLADFRLPYVEESGLRTFRRPAHVDSRWFERITRDSPPPAFEAWMDIGAVIVVQERERGPPSEVESIATMYPPRARPHGAGLFFPAAEGPVDDETAFTRLAGGEASLLLAEDVGDGRAAPPLPRVAVHAVPGSAGHEWTVRTTTPQAGWLAVTEKSYPGWEAEVNGVATPVHRANVAFRAVRVPAGEVTVRFVYRPTMLRLGALLTLLTLLGAAGAIVVGRIRTPGE